MKDAWVSGEGPTPCRLLICGEGPAEHECNSGRPFVGATGQEVNHLLRTIIGVDRRDVYVTNVGKWPLNDKKEISNDEMKMLSTLLWEEIEKVKPKVILALGALATHWFLKENLDMEAVNGIPHVMFESPAIVVPCFHPAAAFRDSSLLQWVVEGFEAARDALDGKAIAWKRSSPTQDEGLLFQLCQDTVALDTEARYRGGPPYMVSASSCEGMAGYCYADDQKALRHIRDHVRQPNVLTLLHNALYDLPQLAHSGIFPARFVDTMVVAFLLQTQPLGLKPLAYRLAGMRMKEYDEVVGGRNGLPEVPEQERIQYAISDSDATLRVYNRMKGVWYARMKEVMERDMQIIPMIISMMQTGIMVDVKFFDALNIEFSMRNMELRDKINEMARRAGWMPKPKSKDPVFNPASAPQVAELLYEKLKLGKHAKIKKTKWGGSTDTKSIKKIEHEHSIVKMIEEWRGTDTLEDKFLSVLPTKVGEDGRIHTKISMVRVKHSGRLASSDPNLMAQPVRTEDGMKIRNGFVASPGFTLVSMDYCLAPNTRILTMDLRWKPIGDLKDGEMLWGIEENCEKSFTPRHMIPSKVERMRTVVLPSYAITTDDGKCIVASGKHPWLAKDDRGSRNPTYKWTRTDQLIPGRSEVWNALDVWDESNQWEDGYLAGAFDGEGSISVGRGIVLTFTQKPGIMLNFVVGLLKDKGYEFHDPWMGKKGGFEGSHSVASIWISNRRDIARFLGTCRPQRLLDKAMMLFLGRRPPMGKSKVTSVTPIGKTELVSIQTSSRTFIAEGLISHNSQIEMRLMAHLSQDPVMMNVYQHDGDIHTDTAMRTFRIDDPKNVDEMKHRYPAKRTGFGIINLITAHGLARELVAGGAGVWTEEKCQELLDAWFDIHPGVRTYFNKVIATAEKDGRVVDMWGREEYIPEIYSYFQHVRETGKRKAVNQGIQSGAQGIIKQAMRELWPKIVEWNKRWDDQKGGECVRPIIQVHDDLLFEIRTKMVGSIVPQIKEVMEGAVNISIPITVGVKTGEKWGRLVKWGDLST